jgi:hypothetical protein
MLLAVVDRVATAAVAGGACTASPNPRLQRTPLRAPLSHQPLDDTRRGGCGVESSPSRTPHLRLPIGTRRSGGSNFSSSSVRQVLLSSNPSLHRTPSGGFLALSLGLFVGRPAPVSSKSLDDTRRWECGVESSPPGAPRQEVLGESRRIGVATPAPFRRIQSCLSSNTSLHRTPSGGLPTLSLGLFVGRPAPVSSKPLGRQRS